PAQSRRFGRCPRQGVGWHSPGLGFIRLGRGAYGKARPVLRGGAAPSEGRIGGQTRMACTRNDPVRPADAVSTRRLGGVTDCHTVLAVRPTKNRTHVSRVRESNHPTDTSVGGRMMRSFLRNTLTVVALCSLVATAALAQSALRGTWTAEVQNEKPETIHLQIQ